MKAKENAKTAVTSTTKKDVLDAKSTDKIKKTTNKNTGVDDDILEGAGLFKFKNS